MGSTIIGCGKSLPKLEVANDELKALVDTNDEWISTRTGIRSRHVAVEETATDLAEAAARQALGLADGGWREDGEAIDPASIDLVIYATITPDVLVPSAAGLLRRRLGLENAIAFDLNAACTGFVYGLTVAECMMAGSTAGAPGAAGRNPVRRALVVGAERLTRVTGWSDRNTCVLFGDGAAAAVVRLADVPYACVLGGRGEAAGLHANSLLPGQNRTLFMDGRAIFRFAVDIIPKCLNQLFEKSGTSLEQVDHVVCHQANSRIIDGVAKRLKAPKEKFPRNIEAYGNTCAASIPILLDEWNRSGRAQKGQRIVLSGFGAGLIWGAAYLEW